MLTSFYLNCIANDAQAIEGQANYVTSLIERVVDGEEVDGEKIIIAIDVIRKVAAVIKDSAEAIINDKKYIVQDLELANELIARTKRNFEDDGKNTTPFLSEEIAF